MTDTLVFTSTSDCVKGRAAITPVIRGVCTIVCCVAIISTTNGIRVEYPQQTFSDIHTISTDSAKWKTYNSGNISLCWDGASTMDANLLYSYQKISEIGRLEEDWNGNGASKFSPQLLDSVRDIVKELPRQPGIFPTARESIQLEYENGAGDYLEFELFEGGRLKKFYCGREGENATEDISVEMIKEVVENFYGLEI